MQSTDLSLWSEPWQQLSDELSALLPRVASSLLLLVLGFALAYLVKNLVQRLFIGLGADKEQSDLFIFRVWNRRYPGQTPSQGIGMAAAYGVFLFFALAAARVVGGSFGQELLGSLLGAAPRLFSVLLILLFAVLLASGAGLLTQLIFMGSGSKHAAFWSRVAAWGIFSACALFTLEPLGLAGQLLGQALLIVLAGASLALGLAFGLGCKDLARELVMDLIKPDDPSR